MCSHAKRPILPIALAALALSLSVLAPPCAALAGEGGSLGSDAVMEGPLGGGLSAAVDGPLAAAGPGDKLGAGAVASGEWGECSWSIDSDGLLRVWPTDGKSGRLDDATFGLFSNWDIFFPWGDYRKEIKSVELARGVVLPNNMSYMFDGCSSLTSLDVSGWDTSHVTNMERVFDGCSSLTSLDVSGWDTSHVTDMGSMFYGCSSLASLDVSGWDTSSVTRMGHMFRECSSLASLDVSGWDTSQVTDIGSMFAGCFSLTTLDLSGWDISSVTSLGGKGSGGMFVGCSSLASLDVSGWDTSSVTVMADMFYNCSSLESLDLSGWDTSSVEYLGTMFVGCSSLVSLDLSGWDTLRVTSMPAMFSGCSALSRIAVGERFDTSKAFPEATGLNGKWWSARAGKWLTVEEIQSTRSGVADTYTNADPRSDISGATVEAIPDQTYIGRAIEPALVVKMGITSLVSGTDYTVSYEDNVGVGTATVTLTGKGDYKGAKAVTFKVVPASIASTTVDAIADQTYTGKGIKPAPIVRLGSTTLMSGTDYALSYKNNTNAGTATVTIAGKGNYTGTKSVTFKIVKAAEPVATQAMHRLYNPNSGEHFYTAKAAERDALVKVGWVYEGEGWTAPAKSNTPVYRLYNRVAGDHHYTMKAAERDALLKIKGWVDEGVGWYSDDAQGTPLYRQYNPNAVTGSHNYTTNKKENDALVKMGWIAEDIGWYGVKQ